MLNRSDVEMIKFDIDLGIKKMTIEMPKELFFEQIDKRALSVIGWRWTMFNYIKSGKFETKRAAVKSFVEKYPLFGVCYASAMQTMTILQKKYNKWIN